MVTAGFKHYLAYLISFFKQFTLEEGGYRNVIFNINIVSGINDFF